MSPDSSLSAQGDAAHSPALSQSLHHDDAQDRAPPAAPLATAVIAPLLVFLLLVGPGAQAMLGDPDTFWHVASGEAMLETWSFPTTDAWSFTAAGKPWIAKEWLSQVLLALAFRAGGWNGVVALCAGSVALTFGLVAWFVRQRASAWLTYWCLASGFMLASLHVLARPHVLAYPLEVIWFAGLARACDARRPPGFGLLAVMLLWANLHGGFTLGLAYAFGFGATALWETRGDRLALARGWSLFLVLVVLVALLTPYGMASAFVTAKLLGFKQSIAIIVEWNPPNLARDKGLLLAVLGWAGLGLWLRPRLSLPRILMITGVLALFLTAMRNAELMAFVLPFLLPAQPVGTETQRDGSPLAWWPVPLVAAVLLVVAAGLGERVRPALQPGLAIRPEACLAFARAHGLLGKRVLNDYQFGGYLISQGVPTFIDGRSELFGADRLEEYNDLQMLLGSDPLAPLDRDHIAWTMFNPALPVTKALDLLPHWRRAYEDGACVVHVRVEPQP